MKIRVFKNMCNGVVRIVLNTEDFSQEDIKLMCQFGEPEVNVGGFEYPSTSINDGEQIGSEKAAGESPSVSIGDEWVRIMHGFPYARGFDMRDYEGVSGDAVIEMADAWKQYVIDEIESEMTNLRSKRNSLPTEEVVNV